MAMCKGLKEPIEYDASGLKYLGELSRVETEELIIDMAETAKNFIEEDIAHETIGSHGDLPPMTDEGRRAEVQDQHAIRQGSQPKPISQSRKKWADIEDESDEYNPLLGVYARRPIVKWE